jgi:hypothetical protein
MHYTHALYSRAILTHYTHALHFPYTRYSVAAVVPPFVVVKLEKPTANASATYIVDLGYNYAGGLTAPSVASVVRSTVYKVG